MSELEYSLERPLRHDQLQFVETSLRSSFSVSDIEASSTSLVIRHSHVDEASEIRKMTKRLLFIAKSLNTDLVFANEVEPAYQDDPQPELEATREVIPVHPGLFTFQGNFLRVFHALNSSVRRFAHDLDAIEQEYPAYDPCDCSTQSTISTSSHSRLFSAPR